MLGTKFSFDKEKYKFRNEIEKIFQNNNLEYIHEWEDCNFGKLTFSTDQSTKIHKKYYEQVKETNFLNIYNKFVKEIIFPHFKKDILYQRFPTFRVQVPNNISVAEFHKDKTYSHSPHEVNIFLPITEAKDTSTIWVESVENKGDYKPMNADYGEYYVWNGSNLTHGNKINITSMTRFSVDFRILPYEKYNECDIKETVTKKMELKLGKYFELLRYSND
tara:strand:- start:2234 stop:2890 length:657 start_codon:yes stop_codon:yes gene_type:complete